MGAPPFRPPPNSGPRKRPPDPVHSPGPFRLLVVVISAVLSTALLVTESVKTRSTVELYEGFAASARRSKVPATASNIPQSSPWALSKPTVRQTQPRKHTCSIFDWTDCAGFDRN